MQRGAQSDKEEKKVGAKKHWQMNIKHTLIRNRWRRKAEIHHL